ncbi:MAG: [FeFe] hydrogenase H-cluster maturation GTPase HydF [Planctomycetaceae bacterium]|nr:[FeFe] hydrogenase H-cluster maturation GTPase HydF [Planctomycetaceae bacterium]
MNETPSAQRLHIGFFGKRNAGKSSIVNAVTGQDLAVVSDVPGTTTDPVLKAMELLPLGPVVIIDTPGFDDEGSLGEQRIRKTKQILNKADIALLVVDSTIGKTQTDEELLDIFRAKNIPYLIVFNKSDLLPDLPNPHPEAIYVSATRNLQITELKERLAALPLPNENTHPLVADLLAPGDLVVLVIPLDEAAPKGRLILPQHQTIRDILEAQATALVVRETELRQTMERFAVTLSATDGLKPKLVITDSQIFGRVAKEIPDDIFLTSFSILFARFKGSLNAAVEGAKMLDRLADGDTVLIAEGCTHHRQCDDIGTVKLPRWISDYTGKQIRFEFTAGREFPDDLSPYRLVVHCGGCMLNDREMQYRVHCALDQGVPMTNYGILIAHINGILPRCVAVF